MKVLFLSDDDSGIRSAHLTFHRAKEIFHVHVIHDAREILEDTDLEDPSTVVYVDMAHAQAEYMMNELYRSGMTTKLIIGILCRQGHISDDMILAKAYGARFLMRPGLDYYYTIVDRLLEIREERGLT